ncbi:MAG: hypothetical protein E7311_01780 [Clostridiales bacterium]|nr:hypothetical protein [Clostridiales bacterium]
MENASKALLIAGAILLVIAIIAIGVGIVSSTRGTIGVAENQISSMEIQMHNEQFKKYEGKGKTYNQVKEILAEMTAYNSGLKDSGLKVQVKTYRYANATNTTINSSHSCTKDPDAIYTGAGCYLFGSKATYGASHTENYLYDIFCEYDATGAVKYIKLVRYYN